MELIVAGRIKASQRGFQPVGETPVPLLLLVLELEADAECAERLRALGGQVLHIRSAKPKEPYQ